MRKIFGVLVFLVLLAGLSWAAQAAPTPATVENGNTLEIVALVAAVAVTTQAIKKGLEALFGKPLVPALAFAISVIVAFFTVAIRALAIGHPFNAALFGIFIQVVIYSSGTFLLIKKISPEPPK
jgi:hypothetical protein